MLWRVSVSPQTLIRRTLMSLQNSTLNWYRENVEDFIANSGHVDMTMLYRKFLDQVSSGRYIMDLGCGAGGASLYFTQQGYQVLAVDGCSELCDYTRQRVGCEARVMRFEELDYTDAFDGIWACASLLHVPSTELPDIFRRMITALKPGGTIYTSFKYGTFEGERNGRRFTDYTEETFSAFIKQFPELTIEDQWISADIRPGRSNEKWLNVILLKVE